MLTWIAIPSLSPIWFEGPLVQFLRANIAVVIPVFILFLKIVVLRISGDVNELIHSIVITPMEVMLIALGFVFAGLSRTVPFETQLHGDTEKDLAGTVLIFVISALLAVMYRANRKVVLYFEKYTVALENSRLQERQGNLVFMPNPDMPYGREWGTAWAVGYFVLAVLIWTANLMLAIFALWQTLARIA
jgi:hypothetical protein